MASFCSFIVICGVLRCLIGATSLDRYFSVVWALVLLIMLLNLARGCEFGGVPDTQISKDDPVGYDMLVTERASDILEENVARTVYSRYGIECSVQVDLHYSDDSYIIRGVTVKGVGELGYLRLFLSDYLAVDEEVVVFG